MCPSKAPGLLVAYGVYILHTVPSDSGESRIFWKASESGQPQEAREAIRPQQHGGSLPADLQGLFVPLPSTCYQEGLGLDWPEFVSLA